ncbi:NADPH-dependent FMN reductase [Neptunomonas antarctica]|uniref:NAD(P)H-dependent FMN reductase n=1 Tax=Neptunomonas antarctica TaxID=619304 RepID=A0A1N7P3A8_9GAMM|nr:NAD(P)H-dependent FMN reductase [Neptunomonas antarctica]
MMKILAFAASSSTRSINKKLVTYAATLLADSQVEVLDLNDYELPLFSEDKEIELGQPSLAKDFLDKITASDAILISFAEHNGSYSAAYKNLFDWCSRINPKVFQNKPMVLLSTSPGAGGAASVLAQALKSAPFFGGDVKASYSMSGFYENFDVENGRIKNQDMNASLVSALGQLAQ